MDEANFMNEGGVVVTNTRAVINGTMYAMANVTSVSMGAIPPSRGGAVGLALVGALIAGVADGGGQAFGGLLLVVGVLWAILVKPTFLVRLGSASGEATALASKDETYVARVVQALQQAVIARG